MASRYPLGPDAAELVLEPGQTRVSVSTPSTVELADLASVRHDFALTSRFIGLYLESAIERPDGAPSALDALWWTAVSTYGRAFANGRRHVGRASKEHLTSEEQGHHAYFIDLRNKHLAHAVNGLERSIVFADLSDRGKEPAGIARIGEAHTRVNRLSRPLAERLQHLADVQVKHTTGRIDLLHRRVADELINIGVEGVYNLPAFEPPAIEDSDPRSPRL